MPVLTGELSTPTLTDVQLDGFDGLMVAVTDLPSGLSPGRPGDNRETLVRRLLHWHLQIQQFSKIPVFDTCYVEPVACGDRFYTVVPCQDAQASGTALKWALDSLARFLREQETGEEDPDAHKSAFDDAVANLRRYRVAGVNTFHFLQAASALNLPVQRLTSRVFCFGTGVHSRWLDSSISDRTSGLGAGIALNKYQTATLLRRSGLPAPTHKLVKSAEQSVEAAKTLGYPVVVKPADKEQGNGVAAHLLNEQSVTSAYTRAAKLSANVLVEKHFYGQDYRLTVFHDRVVKIENRRAGGVTGDGRHPIRDLVAQLQQTPRFRKALRDFGKTMVELDQEALELLEEAGLTPDSVPADGEYVCLRRQANISTGGSHVYVPLEEAHPDNRKLAVNATSALRLDMAGVDLIIPDIGRSWLETGAIVCEINAQPQIGKITTPHIYTDILAELMGGNGHVPVHLLVYRNRAPALEQVLEAGRARGCNAVSTVEGVWLQERRVAMGFASGFDAARALLANVDTRAGLCLLSFAEIMQFGLPTHIMESVTLSGFEADNAPAAPDMDSFLKIIEPHSSRPIVYEASIP